MLLLTDGTVMCQDEGTARWWKLTPNAQGDYVNGAWSALASTPNAPLYYASAVLRDGRVFRAGGEYDNFVSADLLAAEFYDPIADTWTGFRATSLDEAQALVETDPAIQAGRLVFELHPWIVKRGTTL